ncbi:hypothetical protein RFI_19841 [Reticulomyxa filosa]|uniref:Uncharacterized protein n=1 Tax=Reticulomyxa filosa TaxID=46433 RepID=X6MUJ6_RETFI|nr:hypothetical protein RFI_19841 [Reticulomyxa filosa]|eukprot:ETO17484.1 hypothetical protein RFI_19841 [Reticulomyxa filosa]
MGRFFGNACGGWLSHVNVYAPIFKEFPYVLPCLVSGGSFLISFFVVATLVKETSKKFQNQQKENSVTTTSPKNMNGRAPPEKRTTCDIIKIKNVWVTTLFYGYASFLGTGLQAVIPLWVLEKKSHNGFGWKESEIGTVFAIAGPCYTISQLVLFPKFIKWFGYIGTSKMNSLIYGVLILLTPHLSIFRNLPTNGAITILVLAMVALFVLRVMVFTCTFVMINNADTAGFFFFFVLFLKKKNNPFLYFRMMIWKLYYVRATANGIGQTFGSIGRLLAPAILCNIYAYCVDNNFSWPFNYCFVFYLQGFLSFFNAAWLHFLLPEDYEKRCEKNVDEVAPSDAAPKPAVLQNTHYVRTRSSDVNDSDSGDNDDELGVQSLTHKQIELEEINTKK